MGELIISRCSKQVELALTLYAAVCRSLLTYAQKERQTGTKLPVPKNAKPRQHGFEDP